MARSTQYFYDLINNEKDNFTSLNGLLPNNDTYPNLLADLNNNTKVSVWRLLFYVFAYGCYVLDTLFDEHKKEINELISKNIPGTIQWLREEIMKFQYGDTLLWIDNKYQYAIINPSLQIIKYCSVKQVGNQVRIKVAKDVSGMPTPLNITEYNALISYIDKIKFAGTNTYVISNPPDRLKIQLNARYHPMILNSNGELLSNTSIKPVETAIQNYLKNLPFDGKLVVNHLIDAVQKAEGVYDCEIISIEATYASLPYQPINVEYETNAGYIIIDPAYPLSNSINYIPYV